MTDNDYYDTFSQSFSWFQSKAHQLAIDKGWYDLGRPPLELIALIMSELGEAVEAIREQSMSPKILGFTGLEEEFADAVIRIMDAAQYQGVRLAEAIIAKHQYNESRPYRHGGKLY